MSLVELDVRADGIEEIIRDLAATEAVAKKAITSTLVKMGNWLRTRSAKGLSAELKIQQKVIRRRLKQFRVQARSNGASLRVWYGLDPVALIYLKAKQNASGVTADGGRDVKGAFISKGRGGNLQVFKRRGKARLPIDKQSALVDIQARDFLEKQLVSAAEFEAQFFRFFEHELKWRMQTLK